MNLVWQFILCLPELIKLIGQIQKAIDEQEANRKVKHDIQAISEAFKDQDAEKLNRLFNPE